MAIFGDQYVVFDPDTANRIDEYILVADLQPTVAMQDGQQHR